MKKLLYLLMAFLLMGELTEIQSQSLYYGDYVQQVAKIQYINDYGTINLADCLDCKATITIYKNNEIIVNNSNTTEILPALFGYKADVKELSTGIMYKAVFNMTHGNNSGLVVSNFNILKNSDKATSLDSTSPSSCGILDLGSCIKDLSIYVINFGKNLTTAIGDIITSIFNKLGLTDIVSKFTDTIKDWLGFIKPLFTGLKQILKGIIWIFSYIPWSIEYIQANGFSAYIYFIFKTNLLTFGVFFIGNFLLIVIFESLLIAWTSIRKPQKDIFDGLLNIITANFNFFVGVFMGIWYLTGMIFSAIKTITSVISNFKPFG
jgi:hypothetical protein